MLSTNTDVYQSDKITICFLQSALGFGAAALNSTSLSLALNLRTSVLFLSSGTYRGSVMYCTAQNGAGSPYTECLSSSVLNMRFAQL